MPIPEIAISLIISVFRRVLYFYPCFKPDPKPETDKKDKTEDETFIATEIKDKNKTKINASDIAVLTGPWIILASRTPAGRRFIGIVFGIPGMASIYFDLKYSFRMIQQYECYQVVSHYKFLAFYISYSSEIDHRHRLQVYMKKRAFSNFVENVSKIVLINKNCFYFNIYIFLQLQNTPSSKKFFPYLKTQKTYLE